MSMIKKTLSTLVLNAAATIGVFGGIIMLGSGLGEWIEEQTKKIFGKKEEAQ